MEFSSQWPSDHLEDDVLFSLFNQSEISYLNDYFQDSLSEIYVSHSSAKDSSSSSVESTGLIAERPPTFSSCTTEQVHTVVAPFTSPPSNISFGKSALLEPKNEIDPIISFHGSEWNFGELALDGSAKVAKGKREISSSTPEHVIAERKRREKLNQLFIALSAIIPGLKKTDKASLLSNAINYVKQLETKVKILEEHCGKIKSEEHTGDLSKINMPPSSSDTIIITGNNYSGQVNPSSAAVSVLKMEARLTEKTVLLRIHCQMNKGVLVKVLSEIEKRHLSVLSISSIPSECSTLNLTIISNIEEEFSMTIKDLVKDLNSALSQQYT